MVEGLQLQVSVFCAMLLAKQMFKPATTTMPETPAARHFWQASLLGWHPLS
jgi:hypothetical protein